MPVHRINKQGKVPSTASAEELEERYIRTCCDRTAKYGENGAGDANLPIVHTKVCLYDLTRDTNDRK